MRVSQLPYTFCGRIVVGTLCGVCLLGSLAAFCGVAWLLPQQLSVPLPGTSRLVLAAAMLLFVWLTVVGLIGMAQRFLDREYVSVAYLAAASYWIYLVHFPLVGFAQIGISVLPGPALAKYVAVFTVTLLASLVSYERYVRRTFIGRALSGSDVVRRTDPSQHVSAGAVAQAG